MEWRVSINYCNDYLLTLPHEICLTKLITVPNIYKGSICEIIKLNPSWYAVYQKTFDRKRLTINVCS